QAAAAAAVAAAAAAEKAAVKAPARAKPSAFEHGNVAIRLSYIGEDKEATEMSGGVGGVPGCTAVKLPRAPPALVVSGLLARSLDGLVHCVESRSEARGDATRQMRLVVTMMSLADNGGSAVPSLLQLIRALSTSLEQQEEEQREMAVAARHGGGGSAAGGPSHIGGAQLLHVPGLAHQGHAESTKMRGKLHSVRHSLAPYKVLFQLQTLCQQAIASIGSIGGAVFDGVGPDNEAALTGLADELEDVSTVAVRASLMPTLLARGDLHQAVDTAGALEDLFRHLPAAGQTALAGVLAEAAAQPSAPLGLVVAVAAAAGAMTTGQAGQPQEHAAGKSGTSGPRQKKQPQLQAATSSHALSTQAGAAAGAGGAAGSTAAASGSAGGSMTSNFRAAVRAATFVGSLEHAHSVGGGIQPLADEATSLMGSLPAAMMVGRMRELAAHHKAQTSGSKSMVVRDNGAGSSGAAAVVANAGGSIHGGMAHVPVGLVEAVLVGLAENLQSFLAAAAELLPSSDVAEADDDSSIGHAGHVDELVGLVCRCTQRFQERLPVVLQHLQAHLQASGDDNTDIETSDAGGAHGHTGGGGDDGTAHGATGAAHQ
ncbi:hypothetical protein Vretimale_11341, partial [Volvox reticuliferus]